MKRVLGLWPLVATIYFCVSGGPYGLEEVMQSGAGMGLLLILVTPIVWALPAALMTAELASAIPAEGGYYVWVRRAMGPFWGFLCGWWTWVYTWVDTAIYPVLFATYAQILLRLLGVGVVLDGHPWLKWSIGMSIVLPLTALNIVGTKQVGKTALAFIAVLLAPFVVLVALGFSHFLAQPDAAIHPFNAAGKTPYAAFTAGLFVVMWNYLGWDSMSTVAAEVEEPQRSFPRALALGVPLVTLSYFLPALVGIVVLPNLDAWEKGAWVVVAQRIGGNWLAIATAGAGLIAAASLFSSTLLAGSRIPFAVAEDGLLPRFCTRLHPRFGTPWIAILVSAVFYSFFSFGNFDQLAEIDVIVYSSALILEFIALIVLRAKEPDLLRPFRVPGGWFGVGLVALLPTLLLAAAVCDQLHVGSSKPADNAGVLWFTGVALATGPLVWLLRPLWKAKVKP